jgi:SPP1 gp7 family putative phage head morphogenesis protein
MRALHSDAMAWLLPKLPAHLDPLGTARTDAASPLTGDFEEYVRSLIDSLGQGTGPEFDRLLTAVLSSNARGIAQLGIDVRQLPGIGGVVSHFRAWNVQLMADAGRDYAASVGAILDDPASWGLRVEELATQIEERGGVSESHAELIARDQTLKLNGQVNQYRQQAAGVDAYIWSGSLDERERETHLAHEGEKIAWVNAPADTGHPGQDIQCRCVAMPVIAELDDDP